jgi:hypothetical protein
MSRPSGGVPNHVPTGRGYQLKEGKALSGQTFEENVDQELSSIFDHHFGDTYGPEVTRAYERLKPRLIDWVVNRFGTEDKKGLRSSWGKTVYLRLLP